MAITETQRKKVKVVNLIKDINRPKEDIIEYLSNIGIDKVTINTSLEPEIVAKVYSHFKKDIEEQDKHIKKVVDFAQKNRVEIYEADEQIRKEEDERQRKEEEKRLRKIIEDEAKKREEEKRKQELMSFLEREKVLKEQADKIEKERQDKLLELKRKKEIEAKKKEDARKAKKEEPPETKALRERLEAAIKKSPKEKTKVEPSKVQKKEVEDKKPEAEVKKEIPAENIEIPKEEKIVSKEEKKELPKIQEAPREEKPKNAEGETRYPKAKPFEKDDRPKKPGEPQRDFHKPRFDRHIHRKPGDNKNKKSKFEKVTIKDLKTQRKEKDKAKEGDFVKKENKFVPSTPSVSKESKWFTEKKEKERKLKSDFEFEKKKKKGLKSHKVKEISQKEIDEAIRETFAKIEEEGGLTSRSLARKRKRKERLEQEKITLEQNLLRKNVIKVTEFLSTVELANLMNIEPSEIIKKCFDLGMMVSINQRLEKDLIVLVAEEFGFKIEFQSESEFQEDLLKEEPDKPENLKPRSPVVTVMGHVDHGKTSLLDYVRKSNVVEGEAGGITQHIGAYKVKYGKNKEVTFLDTPGHEAFTAMRARGGQAADIVVLVVAADDSVMPQTVEAINHALAAAVPIVIAINKVDKPDANPEKIKKQLADKNILIEEWGGKYQCVEISAKFGKNVDVLLEKILLEAELLELKANPDKNARGVVLESKLDKGKGITATILVQNGTLKVGDCFLAGIYWGKIKAMFDEREKRIEVAKPSTPVQILGFNGMPQAGDTFIVLESESAVKEIATKRQQLKREQDFRQVKFATLDDISRQIKEGKQVDLNIIIKADTDGSAEALADTLHKLATNEVRVKVIHKALGQITESDVLLAEASSAIIIGFNVRPNLNARKQAEKSKVDIRIHNIIYKVTDEIKLALEGMLEPEITEEITATIEVRDIFKIPKIGNVAGCYVQDGKIARNNKVRLLRDGFVIYDGNILSLKRIKDDVREVESGYECGIGLENFNDVKIGDIIEGYKKIETKRKLVLN
jgi:translation initiation factor IF-2